MEEPMRTLTALAAVGILALAGCGRGGPAGGGAGKLSDGKVVLAVLNDQSGIYSQLSGKNSVEAVKNAGYKAGKDIYLALDVASSEFYNGDGTYTLKKSTGKKLTGAELVNFYVKLCGQYPIVSIEDGMNGMEEMAESLAFLRRMGAKYFAAE